MRLREQNASSCGARGSSLGDNANDRDSGLRAKRSSAPPVRFRRVKSEDSGRSAVSVPAIRLKSETRRHEIRCL